jgi:hypothetical protein
MQGVVTLAYLCCQNVFVLLELEQSFMPLPVV